MSISVVLVEPEIPENVGFVARTMKCFNAKSLYIVGRAPFTPKSKAYKTGTAATEILDKAIYCKTLEEALGPHHLSYGFTKRRREIASQRLYQMEEILPASNFNLNVALVFGCESQGLSREHCEIMDKLIKINLPNNDLSLNLSHAVAIALHEIWAHSILSSNPFSTAALKKPSRGPKEKEPTLFEEREASWEFFTGFLKDEGIIKGNKSGAKLNYLRNLWQRLQPNQKELDFLLGLIKSGAKLESSKK